MDAISRDQIDQLAEDISFVKKAIEKNSSILRQIDFRSSLRLMTLLSALSIFFFCGVFQILMHRFHGYSGIPAAMKAVVFSAIALVTIALGVLKNTGVLKSARTVDPGISLVRLIREYYSVRMYHHFFPMGLIFIFSCWYCISIGAHRFIIPLCSIGAGLIYNTLDTLLRMDEFLWASYWFIISGCIVMVYNTISPLLGLSLTVGCGLLLLAAVWYIPHKKQVGQ
jgi:hypothetical protein